MKRMSHQVDVMEPATATDDRGQDGASDTVYFPAVPCSIEPIDSSETEVAHQLQATRTYKVKFYGNPDKPISHRHWLRWGERRLEIGSAKDVNMNGQQWELVCGESVA
jgi:head-tail adaptor